LYEVGNNTPIPYKSVVFSGGEHHVEIPDLTGKKIWVDARIGNADGLMKLLALGNAVSYYTAYPSLFLPYLPGARQDRLQAGFPFTLSIMAEILNNGEIVGWNDILFLDPHSEKTFDFIPRAFSKNISDIVPDYAPFKNYDGVIAPDKGALDRANKFAKDYGIANVVTARKVRDPKTGNLSQFECDPLPVPNGRYIIVDDICDGGGTFIGLAKTILANSNPSLDLFVSHGIFSKGVKELNEIFDKIYTTDSFRSKVVVKKEVEVIELAEYANKYFVDIQ
jgi:ribose-phosphate pyrophosphokinase